MEETSNVRYRLWQMISNSYHLINKARQQELYRHGVSLKSSGVMHAILRLGKKATPVEIARQSSRERHSISEQLSRMEKEGLVKKVKDLQRKNLIRVELTKEGYELFNKVTEQKSIDYIMATLSMKEQMELWILLSRLRDKAMQYLGLKNTEPYPPSDLNKLLPHNIEYPTNLQSDSESLLE